MKIKSTMGNKKTILSLLLVLVLAFSIFGFAACDGGVNSLIALSAPTELMIEGATLSWKAVDYASGYSVQIDNGTPAANATTSFSLANLTATGVYSIKVKAVGDGETYSDSAWPASITYSVAVPVEAGTVDNYTKPVRYSLIVDGFEWGPTVTKVVVGVSDSVAAGAINKDTFLVKAGTTARTVVDAYISDAQGEKQAEGNSYYITIEMKIGYAYYNAIENGSPFSYVSSTGKNIWKALNIYTVALAEGKTITLGGVEYLNFNVSADKYAGRISPLTDGLRKGAYTLNGRTLTYAAYETAELKASANKNPLIIWLHGAGEGGTDIDISLLGNDVTKIMQPDIQKYFKSTELGTAGAYVLAVQTPTMWMDNGNGVNHAGDKPSIYTDALMATIKNYVSSINKDVDTNRIYIGGCSNGGYMTMNMLLSDTEGYFAAGYPICQAYMDSGITDIEINKLKDIPIWFTAAANDMTVKPVNYTNATYARLIRAGAENVHYSYFSTVVGQDTDPPVNHDGHWSWIYTLQDRCLLDQNASAIASAADLTAAKALVTAPSSVQVKVDDDAVSLWEWLAAQCVKEPEVDPPAPGDSTIYGADVAVLDGFTVATATAANAGKVIQGGVVAPGSTIKWTVTSDKAQEAELILSVSSSNNMTETYENQDIEADWYKIQVGTVTVTSKVFLAPGAGTAVANEIFAEVSFGKIQLSAGSNIITITALSIEDWGIGIAPSYDYLKIVTSDEGTPIPSGGTKYQAENAVITGEPSYGESFIEDCVFVESGKSVGNLAKAGNTITWTVTSVTIQKVSLAFNMSSTGMEINFSDEGFDIIVIDQTITSAMLKITVNGVIVPFTSFKITGSNISWGFNLLWQEISFSNVDFIAGANIIKIEVLDNGEGTACPNIDYLKVIES